MVSVPDWLFFFKMTLDLTSTCFFAEMKPQLPHLERGYYESLIIILDTLERCLRQQANILHAHQKNAARGEESGTMMMASVPPCATSKHEEVVNFKNLLKEICHFIGNDQLLFKQDKLQKKSGKNS